MKKSLLALAALGAFAGAAVAQSSVTLYGRVDLSAGKAPGSNDKYIANGSGSRLGVRGVEDLGGGLQALFNLEHRYNADTGMVTAPRFWHGRSIVGLQGGFGQVVFGREYTTAFLQSQLQGDPFGWDTVVAGGSDRGTVGITGGGIVTVRNDSSVTYKKSFGGITIGAQIAEGTDAVTNVPNRPLNFAVNYAAGPLAVGFGHERTGFETTAAARWTTVNASYNLGKFKVGGLIGTGNTATNEDRRSWIVSATAPVGAGEFRAAYGQRKDDPAGAAPEVSAIKTLGLGYHYSLSKRTTVYADYVRENGTRVKGNGADVGIKHNF